MPTSTHPSQTDRSPLVRWIALGGLIAATYWIATACAATRAEGPPIQSPDGLYRKASFDAVQKAGFGYSIRPAPRGDEKQQADIEQAIQLALQAPMNEAELKSQAANLQAFFDVLYATTVESIDVAVTVRLIDMEKGRSGPFGLLFEDSAEFSVKPFDAIDYDKPIPPREAAARAAIVDVLNRQGLARSLEAACRAYGQPRTWPADSGPEVLFTFVSAGDVEDPVAKAAAHAAIDESFGRVLNVRSSDEVRALLRGRWTSVTRNALAEQKESSKYALGPPGGPDCATLWLIVRVDELGDDSWVCIEARDCAVIDDDVLEVGSDRPLVWAGCVRAERGKGIDDSIGIGVAIKQLIVEMEESPHFHEYMERVKNAWASFAQSGKTTGVREFLVIGSPAGKD